MTEVDRLTRRQEEVVEREVAERLGPRTLGEVFPDIPAGVRSLVGKLAAQAVKGFRAAGEPPLLARVVAPATAEVTAALEGLRGRIIQQVLAESRGRVEDLARTAVEWCVIAWKHESGGYLTEELARAGTAHVLERLTVREVHRAVQWAANQTSETGTAVLDHHAFHNAAQQVGQSVSRVVQEQLRFDMEDRRELRRKA